MRRLRAMALCLALALASASLGVGTAQVATHLNLEEALERAMAALRDNTFSFSYSFWPSPDADSPIRGEGEADLANHAWRYTVGAALADGSTGSGAESQESVGWIVLGGAFYHDSGGGWSTEGLDFTYAGVPAMIQPFASYQQMKVLADGDPDSLQQVRYLGLEVVDGVPAQGYAFATSGMPAFGSADFEMWLSEGPAGYERILLVVTPVGGKPNRIAFTRIGEPVAIEAPL